MAPYNRAMRLVMVDDSVPFDGTTAAAKPLGGAQRDLSALATALANQGCTVDVVHRGTGGKVLDGVSWRGWVDLSEEAPVDVVMVWRSPTLFARAPKAAIRLLWTCTPPGYLRGPGNAALLQRYKPRILVPMPYGAHESVPDGDLVVVRPGIAEAFRGDAVEPETRKPIALLTAHPHHGVLHMLGLWADEIMAEVPEATLHVVSATLSEALRYNAVPLPLEPLVARIRHASDRIKVIEPGPEALMAAHYREAAVLLYPGHAKGIMCWTLREAMACGLPPVARDRGGVSAWVTPGHDGYVAPDDEAIVALTVALLRGGPMRASLSAAAMASHAGRPWSAVAGDIIRLVG